MADRAQTLQEVMRIAVEAGAARLRVSVAAVVTAYDAGKRRATCKPLVREPYRDESDARQTESCPAVTGVPVVFPSSGIFGLTFPISDGNLVVGGSRLAATTGMLVFSDRSLDKWLSGRGAEVDPEIDHVHDISDAVFYPGLYPFGAVPQASPTDHVALGEVSGNDWVALAAKVADNFDALKQHFDAIEAVLTGTAINEPGNGAPSALQAALKLAISPSNTYPTPSSVAASQVKAK